jgi:electron transfer flavoprotein beta subunit
VEEDLWQKGLACKLNPLDAQALASALKLKDMDPAIEITMVSIGPERVEKYLRDGMSLGADKAVRIWEESCLKLSPFQIARLLSRLVDMLKADLVLMGARSQDNGSGLVGPLMAAWLEIPCVCETVDFQLEADQKSIIAIRNVSRGVQEKVQSGLPVVLAFTGNTSGLPYASLDGLLASRETAISRLTLADLGISPLELKDTPLGVSGLSFPRPRPKSAPLDSSLPAFYRILALLQGGIVKRRGALLSGQKDELINQLYDLLIKEEVIKPPIR